MTGPAGTELLKRLDELALVTDEAGFISRSFLSPAMHRTNRLVGTWMKELGCSVMEDDWGNLIGHLEGSPGSSHTLLLGSHLDTVRHAGKFDGPLGVLVAIASLQQLAEEGTQLPFHVDIVGFSDEEGSRFHSAYLGSKALTGLVTKDILTLCDVHGTSLGETVMDYQKTKEITLPLARYAHEELLGYIEVHIEQGPVLQEMGIPLGVVDHIAAQSRLVYNITGCAGHAGTTPMNFRRDALAGAAEIILAVESIGRETSGLVATVGQAQIEPGVSNVISSRVRLSVDIRHAQEKTLQDACLLLDDRATEIATRRRLEISNQVVQSSPAIACSPAIVRKLEEAVGKGQKIIPHLVSGAGHDGVVLSQLAPVGMLFVRCRDGLSHHPDEYASADDIGAACAALTQFLRAFP